MKTKVKLVSFALCSCLLVYTQRHFLLPSPPMKIQIVGFDTQGRQDFLGEDGAKNAVEKKVNNTKLELFKEQQRASKERINGICQKNTDSLPLFQKGFSSIIMDRVNKLTYCPIYKVASTSWALTLLELRQVLQHENKPLNRVRTLLDKTFEKIDHKKASKVTKNTTKFIIVRNPFERLISAYRDKFQNGNKYYFYKLLGEKMVMSYRPQIGMSREKANIYLKEVHVLLQQHKPIIPSKNPFTNPVGPTFKEFVQYVVSSNPDDDHWRPFYIQCSLCSMKYDYVLRFENLSEDSKFFIEEIGKSHLINTKWENPTASGATTESILCSFLNTLDASLMQKLLTKYYFDFQMFNYSSEKYIHCNK